MIHPVSLILRCSMSRYRSQLLSLVAVIAFTTAGDLPSTPAQTVVHVRDQTLHRIDDRLFGQFLERPSWGGETGVEVAVVPGTHRLQPEVMRRIEDMRIPLLRFPGGTDVDYMDWRDMIDGSPTRESAERPVSVGHKGGEVTNRFGFDEFLQLCQRIDSEAILVANFRDLLFGTKPREEALEDAAAFVAYVNAGVDADLPENLLRYAKLRERNGHAEPYEVKLWQLGNETWAFGEQLQREYDENPMRHYADQMIAMGEAMLAVDPDIRFIVDGQQWTIEATRLVQEHFGDKIACFVHHPYQPWGIGRITRDGRQIDPASLSREDIWKAWVATPGFDDDGNAKLHDPLIDLARREGRRVGLTEWNWNGWWQTKPVALDSAMAKGVGAAGFLHAMMRSGDVIDLACQSMLVGNGWGIQAIYVGDSETNPTRYRPSGLMTTLYNLHHGDRRLSIDTSNVPTYVQPYRMSSTHARDKVAYLDIIVTADDDKVYVHVINRHFNDGLPMTVDLSDVATRWESRGTHYHVTGRLDDQPAEDRKSAIAEMGEDEFAVGSPATTVTVPRRSVSVYEFTRAGS